jgi:beta-xylosidase
MISFTFYVTTIALLSTLLRPCRTSTLPFQGTNFPWQNPARLTTINHDLRADLQSYPKRSLNYSLALPIDFPDPSIYKVDDRYWAFATTNNVDTNVQVATSSDFKTWIYLQDYDALPFAGTWTYNITSANGWQSPRTWAPNVIQNDEGLWVMYYSALATQDLHCTGVATATNIQGPYVPIDDEPLVCPLEVGGAIDASGFRDVDGTRWIVYKIDGNSLVSVKTS